jgi:hypothetical protein
MFAFVTSLVRGTHAHTLMTPPDFSSLLPCSMLNNAAILALPSTGTQFTRRQARPSPHHDPASVDSLCPALSALTARNNLQNGSFCMLVCVILPPPNLSVAKCSGTAADEEKNVNTTRADELNPATTDSTSAQASASTTTIRTAKAVRHD